MPVQKNGKKALPNLYQNQTQTAKRQKQRGALDGAHVQRSHIPPPKRGRVIHRLRGIEKVSQRAEVDALGLAGNDCRQSREPNAQRQR